MFLRRIALFIALNFLVVFVISAIATLLNIGPLLTSYGLNYGSLALFCSVWGMGGAFISLLLSKTMAKWLMRVQIIDPKNPSAHEKPLLNRVYHLAKKAGLTTMPEVGIYQGNEVNAFATGPSASRSLVALSSGLLARMNEQEVDGVIAHELSHIANGDMVTMTLLQGVVNAFVMFLSRVLAFALSGLGKNRDQKHSSANGSYFIFVYLFQFVFMLLGSLLIAAYSRWREYRADLGGAQVAGKGSMVAALKKLESLQEIHDAGREVPQVAALKISAGKRTSILSLFATHPPLAKRIERLIRATVV